MLSIGKLVAGQERYYEQQVARGRDDYYAGRGEAEGRWVGARAAVLGLGGEVDADAFGALIAGRDPGNGEVLREGSGRDRVCASDLTFSAPKSVSVLFAIGDAETSRALVEAHVMAQVGDADESTTLRIYAKVLRRDRRHVGQAVDEMVGGALPVATDDAN